MYWRNEISSILILNFQFNVAFRTCRMCIVYIQKILNETNAEENEQIIIFWIATLLSDSQKNIAHIMIIIAHTGEKWLKKQTLQTRLWMHWALYSLRWDKHIFHKQRWILIWKSVYNATRIVFFLEWTISLSLADWKCKYLHLFRWIKLEIIINVD